MAQTALSSTEAPKTSLADLEVDDCMLHCSIPTNSVHQEPYCNDCDLSYVPECPENDAQASLNCGSTVFINSSQRPTLNENENKLNFISSEDNSAPLCVKEEIDSLNSSEVSISNSALHESTTSVLVVETESNIQASEAGLRNLVTPVTLSKSSNQELLQPEKQDLIKALQYIKHLEIKQSSSESEIADMLTKLNAQEVTFKKVESQMRTEFLSKIEKLSKECNILRKEKESIVIRYATSEKDVIQEKKIQQELEKKMKDMNKERENLLSKIKGLVSENNRLSSLYENKMVEVAKLQKNFDKLNEDFHSKEIRIKWLQNKLKTETNSHQETQGKLEYTIHRLNEMKEEAEQVRKNCQEMIKCYQEAEEIKSVKLDGQLKLKVSELEVQKQEKSDQEQVYQLLRQELDALKKKQRMTMEENNFLTSKIQGLEKDRLEYEQNLSKLKDSQNLLKQEVVDLNARLAEMETLHLQLEREKEKSAASLREVERLRSTNAELQADMNACHIKEGELLKFTEGVTDTNVKLQSAHSLLEVKAQALEEELIETKKLLEDIQQKHQELVSELDNSRKQHQDEVQLLARKLAEKTKNVEKLNTKLDEAENENRVLKRRHIASIKELSRELHDCKRRLDGYESNNGIRTESASLGSRSSSTASLDVMNSNENRFLSPIPASAFFNGKKETSSTPPQGTSSDIPEIDKEMLIERIIKLQKTLARKNDKIDFLEDHIVQLVKEMRKKNKCVDFKTV